VEKLVPERLSRRDSSIRIEIEHPEEEVESRVGNVSGRETGSFVIGAGTNRRLNINLGRFARGTPESGTCANRIE